MPDTADTAELQPALRALLLDSREAARTLAGISTAGKNAALLAIADALRHNSARIIAANAHDVERGRSNDIGDGLIDRLLLSEKRVEGLAAAVEHIVGLPDPIGEVVRGSRMPNGVQIAQTRVPFGVVGAIYEARPNVTVDIAALALKSGNAAVLRGGSAAEDSNRVLVDVVQAALRDSNLPAHGVQTIDSMGRAGATELMRARGLVDVLIPRGSAALIQTVVAESLVPVIETGSGVVHIFLDESAPLDWSVAIVHNSKVQRPSVCNAVETLLVHRAAAERLLPPVLAELAASGVTIHGDEATRQLFSDTVLASDDDWAAEYLSLDLAVRVVDSIDEAIEHIRRYSTHHTESIVTRELLNAERFLTEVDSAAVMVNTSTRFTDGAEFGFGAEVGISTQKLHARGPMGLQELTSTKWIVRGAGQVRA